MRIYYSKKKELADKARLDALISAGRQAFPKIRRTNG